MSRNTFNLNYKDLYHSLVTCDNDDDKDNDFDYYYYAKYGSMGSTCKKSKKKSRNI